MPGFVTGIEDPPKRPVKKVATVAVVALALFVATPVAGAGIGNDVPNPGWEVD